MGDMNSNVKLYKQTLSYRQDAAPCQCLSQAWFVHVPHPIHAPRYRCALEPIICGEAVFKRIATDLEQARSSVDIITWGFDPGMVLVRGATAEDGVRYGDLLKQIAARRDHPVKVRLLVWHDDVASQVRMKNNPGYYGTQFPNIGSGAGDYYSEYHQAYNAQWYAQACANELPNIHFHVRHMPYDLLEKCLEDEPKPKSMSAHAMAKVAELYATHHQKMLLIDYESPSTAIGYVMGHNSVTDFWDTAEHLFRDPRRERFYRQEHVAVQKEAWKRGGYVNPPIAGYMMSERQRDDKERAVQYYLDQHSYVAKPYQDVSCRMQGPILYDLNHHFCEAWQTSARPASLFLDLPGLKQLPEIGMVRKIGDWFHDEMDPDFIARREKIRLSAFRLPKGRHNVQLLRTQPANVEKSIKECYANLTRQALHYIFIQNQYIQYEPWADHLLACINRLRAAGYVKPMYVFLLTSTPENSGMDWPTYDVAGKLGHSASMKVEHDKIVEQARKNQRQQPISAKELADHGINVFMGSLWTCAKKEGQLTPQDYEEIYIHTKVAIVDDAAFTLGSANLNLRSMAFDSELNIVSEAMDVVYQLRADLFAQCTGDAGPDQFADMYETFKKWKEIAKENLKSRSKGEGLEGQLLPFYVNREPGIPVV